MYGLRDSAIIGTYKRVAHVGGRRGSRKMSARESREIADRLNTMIFNFNEKWTKKK